jgi:hypothetical protein
VAGAITVRELVTVLTFRTDKDKLDRYEQTVKKVSERMVDFGKKASLFVSLPLALAGAAALKMASDAEETASKFGVVFSDVAEEAQQMAEHLRSSFGLSRKSAQQLLGDTGDLLTGFGFAGKEALDLSSQVNMLAVDLASFTNFVGGAEGASKALTKALLGERESVKELGIAILEKDVQEEMAILRSQGQRFATERQAKAWATLSIALRQSRNAIGDFQRTQFQFANQMRIVRGRINDVAVGFGKRLIPAATKLAGVAVKVLNRIDGLSGGTKRFILVLGGLLIIVPPIITAVFALRLAFIKLGASVLWIPLLVLAVIAVLALFIDDFLAWRNDQESILGMIFGDYQKFGQGISDFFEGLFTFLFHLWEGHWDEVIAGLQHFVDTIVIMFQDMGEEFKKIPVLKWFGQLLEGVGAFVGGTKMLAEEAGAAAGGFVGRLGVSRPETIRLSPEKLAQLRATGSVSIVQETNVTVPAGTTPDQATAIARVARAEVRAELNESARQMVNSSPVVE